MGILHKKVIDFNNTFSSVVIPKILIKYLMHASHDSLGHVGAIKLYHFLKRLYYFQGMWKEIHQYVRSCQKCQIMNLQKPHYINLHQDIAQTPQDHISIDPIGPYNTTSQRQLICPHCGMQPYRLPYDNPHTRQKDSNSSYTLVFGNNAQIWFPKNITF